MGKDFVLYGYLVSYPSSVTNYNYIIKNLRRKGDNVRKTFSNKYYSMFSNMDESVRSIDELFMYYIGDAIDWVLKFFAGNKVYKYDAKRFFAVCSENGVFDGLFEAQKAVEEQYVLLLENQEELAAYRRARKDARGRWQGGGFGVEGAVKGALTAGTANLASGLAHSAFNTVGNAATAVGTSIKKNKMYKDSNIINRYITELINSMELMALVVSNILVEETGYEVDYPSVEDEREGNAVVNNILQGYIKDETAILERCIEVLQSNPYNNGAYNILREIKDDPDGTLDNMAQYFGVMDIHEYKEKTIRDILSNIDYYSVGGIDEGKKRLKEWCEKYCVEYSTFFESLETIRERIVENVTTVDGQRYGTQKDAEDAHNNIFAIIDLIAETEGNDTEKIREIIELLQDSQIHSKDKYIEYLQEELELEKIRSSKVKGVIYSTKEYGKQARTEAIELDEMIMDLTTDEKVKKIKNKIQELKTEDLKELYTTYLCLCEKVIEEQNIDSFVDAIATSVLRKDIALQYYLAEKYKERAERLYCLRDEFKHWFEELSINYCTVNGVKYDNSTLADKAYYKWIEHANQYMKYMNEKNADKKSFLSSIKTAATGLIYKNYESEYNALTDNGTRDIPEDRKSDYDDIKKYLDELKSEEIDYETELKDKYDRIFISAQKDNRSLDVAYLYKNTPEMKKEVIKEMIDSCCSGVHIRASEKEFVNSTVTKAGIEVGKGNAEIRCLRLLDIADKREFVVKKIRELLVVDKITAEKLADTLPSYLGEPQGVVGEKLEELYKVLNRNSIRVEYAKRKKKDGKVVFE